MGPISRAECNHYWPTAQRSFNVTPKKFDVYYGQDLFSDDEEATFEGPISLGNPDKNNGSLRYCNCAQHPMPFSNVKGVGCFDCLYPPFFFLSTKVGTHLD